VTTRVGGTVRSVPVTVELPDSDGVPGRVSAVHAEVDALVLVVGEVRRRFFRAGGVTQSRTEVLASAAVPWPVRGGRTVSTRRQVDGLLTAAIDVLGDLHSGRTG
jgi:hypothetical protein